MHQMFACYMAYLLIQIEILKKNVNVLPILWNPEEADEEPSFALLETFYFNILHALPTQHAHSVYCLLILWFGSKLSL